MIFGASYVLLWTLVVMQALVILFLVRQLSELRRIADLGFVPAAKSLPPGSPAPQFSAIDARSGQAVHSASLRERTRTLLFLSTECSVCKSLVAELSQLPAESLSAMAVLCQGTERSCLSYLQKIPSFVPALTKATPDLRGAFQLAGFPAVVRVDEAWRVVRVQYLSEPSQLTGLYERAA